jgi:hypothetical protein
MMHIVATECCHPTCTAKPSETLDLPLCDRHALQVYRAVRGVLDNAHPFSTAMALEPVQPKQTKHAMGEVYFVSFAGRIKIGFSTNLRTRLKSIPHDAVLATIPGTRATEGALHRRFAHLRTTTGEWFEAGDDLLAYIDETKARARRLKAKAV